MFNTHYIESKITRGRSSNKCRFTLKYSGLYYIQPSTHIQKDMFVCLINRQKRKQKKSRHHLFPKDFSPPVQKTSSVLNL